MPVRYAMHWVAQSEEVLLLGQDQRPVMEMQQQLMNAQIALEQDYEAQRELDTRYRLLMDFTSDAVALVSATTGGIVDLEPQRGVAVRCGPRGVVGDAIRRAFQRAQAWRADVSAVIAAGRGCARPG